MIGRFGQILKLLPLLAPADITTSTTLTGYVNLANAHRCTFLLQFGAITPTSADESGPTVTLLASSAATTASEVAIGFNYRLSSAVASDAWGDVTWASADVGKVMATSDDNKVLLIDVDPTVVRNATANANGAWVHAVLTPVSGSTIVGGIAEIEPRYAQNSMISAS